jgi:hypothetical protein
MAEFELDVISEFGADEPSYSSRLGVYIPSHDKNGRLVDQNPWVDEIMSTLCRYFGGATALPPAKGIWRNPETDVDIIDAPVYVYSYIKPAFIRDAFPALKDVLHRMGRETNQGAVAGDVDNQFFTISSFDAS